jgi:acetylornithine deacetylase/succinyl-diaminopimelate desuccinylase-like protein
MASVDSYLDAHREQFEQDLCELLRIPSVSADSKYRTDVAKAADWVAAQFTQMGLKTEVAKTSGNPIVLAESAPVPGGKTVLVYGHYDVQPPDPLELWESPPFEPTIRNGNVYARGATDDKGQMLTHVKAAQAWMATEGKLPVQLKFLIEGEEEVGSVSLGPFLAANRERLKCDCVVVSDTSQFAPGQPAITYGLRGIAYYELHLTGPNRDLHSGTFGGGVHNPANVLTEILAALRGPEGRVNISGFYDDVTPLTEREREEFRRLPFDEAAFAKQLGIKTVYGEAGFSTLERRWARPTFDINGLTSGYQGEGAKTVLPSKASAKFSFRLVPNQDPAKISAALEKKLKELCPPGIQMELVDHHGAPGVVVPLESPYVAAAQRAIEHGFGRAPVFIREGGSIPVVATFRELLGVDTLLLGWGLDDDNTHSPNEKFSLADFHRAIKASARLWQEIGTIGN